MARWPATAVTNSAIEPAGIDTRWTDRLTAAACATGGSPGMVAGGLHRLERALGIGDFAEGGSARRIVPHLQSLTLGDTVALSRNGGFTVVGLDPARSLVLHIPMDPLTGGPASAHSRVVLDWTWAFVLEPVDQGCRLLIRVRGDLRPHWLTPTLLLLDPVHLVMERKMLLTIKQCAEAHEPQGPSTRITGEGGGVTFGHPHSPRNLLRPATSRRRR